MAATTRGYPYPASSDDVNVPGDVAALAEAVNDDVDLIDADGWVTTDRIGDEQVTLAKTSGLVVGTRNELTANQAGLVDGNTTGFTFTTASGDGADTNPKSGTYCLKVTSSGAGSASAFMYGTSVAGSATKVVSSSTAYLLTVSAKAPTITSSLTLRVYWWKSDKTAASTATSSTSVTLTSSYQTVTLTATSPADAAYASFRVFWSAAGASEIVRLDEFGFWEGTSGTWALPDGYVIGPYVTDGIVGSGSIVDGAVSIDHLSADVPGYIAGNTVLLDAALNVMTLETGATQSFSNTPLQVEYVKDVNAALIADVRDSLAPLRVTHGGQDEWYAGNHDTDIWTQTAGALTTAEVGKVWVSGSDRITLMGVSAGTATWSQVHNAAVTARVFTAPSGTWTCAGKPDVTFSPAAGALALNTSEVESGEVWTSGYNRVAWRRVTQKPILHLAWVAAQQASVGTPVALSAMTPAFTLVADWKWFGDQPGVALVDVLVTAHQDLTIVQWSGLQCGVCDGTPKYNAFVGVEPAHELVTWNAAPSSEVATAPADWADDLPPSVSMSRNAYGGVALGILASSADRTLLSNALRVNSSRKQYPIAMGAGNGTLTSGSSAWVRGWRSFTDATSDRHVHIVTDPNTGTVHWWLMAGSTGVASHPGIASHIGAQITTTRGTAVVERMVTSAGFTVTTSGWAEGTLTY